MLRRKEEKEKEKRRTTKVPFSSKVLAEHRLVESRSPASDTALAISRTKLALRHAKLRDERGISNKCFHKHNSHDYTNIDTEHRIFKYHIPTTAIPSLQSLYDTLKSTFNKGATLEHRPICLSSLSTLCDAFGSQNPKLDIPTTCPPAVPHRY